MPTGRVFFTGGEKKATTSTTRGLGTRNIAGTGTTSDRPKRSTEEVVGQLDVAIGSSKSTPTVTKSMLESLDYEEQDKEFGRPTLTGQANLNLDGVMYDSDSSEEEAAPRGRRIHNSMAPLELPFPVETLPVGVGEAERPLSYETPDIITSELSTLAVAQSDGETGGSPFVSEQQAEDVSWERDSWFLMQLPTRLPPLKQNNPNTTSSMDVDDDGAYAVNSSAVPTSSISEVVTQPVVTSGFDNVLLSAAPGRIGKMVVYKSGKTILVMEGPNNSTVGCPRIHFFI
jgi:hypothetical protein